MLQLTEPVARCLSALLLACSVNVLAEPARAQTASAPTGPVPVVRKIALPGLAAPARILIDPWGVPHIDAASSDDLFFVQGFNAARDRLFQIDLWRRRGLGRLAAVLGPNFVEQDRAARLFLYRGDMAREWAAYGPNAQRTAARFAAGINAYIDHLGRSKTQLPFEFGYFGYAPEKWQADDVVRIRSHGLTRNLLSEVSRALVACRADLKADTVRVQLSPPWQTQIPPGLDPCIPPEALRAFSLATQGVLVAGRDGRRSAVDGDVEGDVEGDIRMAGELGNTGDRGDALGRAADGGGAFEGSNAWVVAGARSASGRPILASDPHRIHALPSLRYIVHLKAPGLDVIGGGEPSLPGVSIGHNGTAAFGLTIFAIDQEDLYVYETNPGPAGEYPEYRYQGRWERMRTVTESIAVLGRPPVQVELLFTRHGPVTHVDRARNRAYAVRSGWFEPGMAPYFGSIGAMRATSFAGFRRALANWGAPSVNQLYADVHGSIGWVTAGLAPVRPNWDGLLPVPGDGRYEWAGFHDGDALPWAANPAQGWLASANEMNLPAGHPSRESKLGFEWAPRARHQRIAERLQALPQARMEDAMRLQNDVLSVPARRLQAVLRDGRGLRPGDAGAAAAVKLLLNWDLQETGDSAAAALFEVWWSRHLGPNFKDAVLPRAAAALIASADAELLLGAMEKPGTWLEPDAVRKRDEILERSLAAAWADMLRLGGPDPAAWQWGKLHHTLFAHPLANAGDEATKAKLNVGPFAKQGGSDTVNVSPFDPATFRQLGGPSLRIVVDVGDWDNSRAVNTPGQSGDPASPHYRDLAPLWLKGAYFPLLYSRARVEAAAVERIELVPGRTGTR